MEGRCAWGAVTGGWRKGPWTPHEDELLTEHVRLRGEGKWNSVSPLTGLRRCGKSCRLRWVNYLRPGLKRGKITAREEAVILELHRRWGNRWSTIARSLPGRTDNEIKNYWRTHFKKERPEKELERARAKLLRQQQQQKKKLLLRQQQQEEEEEFLLLLPDSNVKEEAVSEAKEAVIAEEMQEMTSIHSMLLGFLEEGGLMPGGSTASSGQGSNDDEEFCATWGDLWSLDDVGQGLGDPALSFC